MPMTYEQAVAEVQKLPNGEDILANVLDKVHSVNKEAQTLRQTSKQHEQGLTKLKDVLKKYEIDPDGDLDEQFSKIKSKDGLVPLTEMEKLNKQLEKFQKDHELTKKELADHKAAIEKRDQDLIMEKAKNAFSPKMAEKFGKAANVLLEYAMSKGQIVVKDGVPGVLLNDEFTPLNLDKGLNGIDVLAKAYPEFAITKQVPGSKTPDGKGYHGDDSNEKTMTRAEHDALGIKNPKAAMQFVRDGGVVIAD